MTGLATAAGDDRGGEEDAVAVSLIDALQRWADALEAQIDIMRSEVDGVRDANKQLARQARRRGAAAGCLGRKGGFVRFHG